MKPDERPLPQSLTRYLAAPYAGANETTRRRAELRLRSADPGSRHQALESALLRGFVYVTSGLVWLLVLGLVMRHLAG